MRALLARCTAAALLAALLGGCLMSRERVNEPIDPALLTQLEPGRSTAADVAQVLGGPAEVVQLGRRSAWRYDYALTKRAGLFLLVVVFQNIDLRSDRVWVFFDEAGVLTHVGSTFSAEDAEWAMPWEDVDDSDDEADEIESASEAEAAPEQNPE